MHVGEPGGAEHRARIEVGVAGVPEPVIEIATTRSSALEDQLKLAPVKMRAFLGGVLLMVPEADALADRASSQPGSGFSAAETRSPRRHLPSRPR
jgi:hypothetical protein